MPEDLNSEALKKIIKDRKLMTELAYRSFFYFILFYFGEHIKYPLAPFHYEMLKIGQEENIKRAVVMAFRNSGKSTILNTAYAIWCIVGAPQKKHVVIASQTQQRAKDHLMNDRKEFENNQLLKENTGPFTQEDRWHSTALVIPKYEARITAISVEEGVRGLKEGHYRPQVIIADDIEDSNSVKNKEAREKSFTWFTGELLPLGDIDTKVIVLGNYLHPESVCARLYDMIKSNQMEGTALKVPIIEDDGTITWPEKFKSMQMIEEFRKSIGNEVTWQRDFMLRAIADDMQIIDPRWIHRYDKLPDEEPLYTFTGIDLACKGDENSDFTAMVSIRVYQDDDWKLHYYVLPEVVNEKITIPEAIKRLSITCRSLGSDIAVENTGLEIAMSQDPSLEDFKIEVFKLKGRDKRTRLSALSNLFYTGQILFPEKGSKSDQLIEQILGFGKEKHDDLVDAFSCAMHVALDKKYFTHCPVTIC